jgi:alpha-glucosidase
VDYESNDRLRIKIVDNSTARFEVPLQINPPASSDISDKKYEVQFSNDPTFSFRVVRTAGGTVLFDTSMGGFTFSEQFLQFSTKLPTKNLYGIGENEQPTFRHNFDNYLNWPLYGRDQPPDFDANMYGVQPYYTVLEDGGSAHSVAIVNSNAQEFTILPTPGILYRTIGGVLDFRFFLGPTPEQVVQQYTEAVGRAPLPPYWALGFQICRYGYNHIDAMKAVVERTKAAGIPQDVQYGDIDIMDRALDFTVSAENFPGLAAYVEEIKAEGVKFITILDPCISIGEPRGSYRPFDLGEEMKVWVTKKDGVTPVTGLVWPEDPVYFPDYSKSATRTWWITLIKEFQTILKFDALWIDMNEPANFVNGDISEGCEISQYNNPPYVPKIRGGHLADKTICGEHRDFVGKHYDTHSLFGWFESEPTLAGVKESFNNARRGFILSRSTFLGSGRWAAHWLGDNWSEWDNLHFSIIGILQFNQFGIPFVGPDTCGFIGNATEELCQRWSELGAFYPFARNHNGLGYIEQDPAVWGESVANSTREALLVRYTLLPYLYTLFYQHTTQGTTIVRALWHEFPGDANTHGIDKQFLWGKGFLISPVLDEGATTVSAYMPNARVYDYFTNVEQPKGQNVTLPAPLDVINLHLIGGNILPTQEPALNTVLSREKPFGLIVALDATFGATGQLYYDAGDSPDPLTNEEFLLVDYVATPGGLTATIRTNGYPEIGNKSIETIRIIGTERQVQSVTVEGEAHTDFEIFANGVLITGLSLPVNAAFAITYTLVPPTNVV